ncbi:MAG: TPM domain-containing protein [Acidobacteriia bacterium]|nr:TPM domain-containing protein [Terriglobia bacterium]
MVSILKLCARSFRTQQPARIHRSGNARSTARFEFAQSGGMKWIVRLSIVFLLVAGLLVPVIQYTAQIPLKPQGYVSDFANMLSPSARQQIEQLAVQLEREQRTELAVVTVPSIGNRAVQDYAIDLFAQWGIGKKGVDNGLLLLVAKNDRQMWIEVGYGLEDKVPDATASEIYRVIRDRFRQGDYDGGMITGVQMLASAVGGTLKVPPPRRSGTQRSRGGSGLGIWVLFGFLILFGLLKSIGRAAMGRPAVRSGSSIPWWLIFLIGSGRGGGGSSWGGGGFSGGGGGFGGFGGGMSGGGGAGGGW